jgi:hypothetical protein
VELHVFQEMDSVDDQHDLMDRQRHLRIRVRIDFHGRRVGSDEHRALLGQPLAGRDADTGISSQVAGIVFPPQFPPAGMDDDGVSPLQRQFLAGQSLLQILHCNLVRIRERIHAFQGRKVDEFSELVNRPGI